MSNPPVTADRTVLAAGADRSLDHLVVEPLNFVTSLADEGRAGEAGWGAWGALPPAAPGGRATMRARSVPTVRAGQS